MGETVETVSDFIFGAPKSLHGCPSLETKTGVLDSSRPVAQSWRSHSPAEHVLLLSLFPPLENRGSNSTYFMDMAFQMVLVIENMPANVGDIREAASIPGLGRFLGGGHGNPAKVTTFPPRYLSQLPRPVSSLPPPCHPLL